jgi:hypothetical protein
MIRTLKTVVLAALLGLCLAPQAKAASSQDINNDSTVILNPAVCVGATAGSTYWMYIQNWAQITTPNAGTPQVNNWIIVHRCFTSQTVCDGARTATSYSQAVGSPSVGTLNIGRTTTACFQGAN